MKNLFGTTVKDSMRNADNGANDGGASTDVGNAPSAEPVSNDNVSANTGTQTDNGVVAQPNNTATNEIEIDGFGKVKIDELKEWKSGYMRQSDYTKKTQEISKQRQENQQALELYNYLKNNPQIAQAISNGDLSVVQGNPAFNSINPLNSQFEQLNSKIAGIELDGMINNLKSKFPDFNEIEVLTEADRMNVTDLEFVYHALKGKELPTMEQRLRKEIEKNIMDKLKQNAIDTQSIITGNDSIATANHGLSDAESTVAVKMGLSPELYAKFKQK